MGVWGPEIRKVFDGATDVFDIPCGGVATYYSRAISLINGRYFALKWKAASDGDVALKIEYEMSDVLPTTEGSADANYVVPESASDIDASLTDENWHIDSLSPPAMKYIRFKITGSGANDASTTLQIRLSVQEEA